MRVLNARNALSSSAAAMLKRSASTVASPKNEKRDHEEC